MNGTERAYAETLEQQKQAGEVLWYAFEAVTFKLAKDCRYTPDFMVMLANCEIELREVKGSLSYIQDDAMVKIKVAASLFPFRFWLIAPIAKKHGGGWNVKEVGAKADSSGA